jgi:NAD-dependent DNA ligase
VLTNDARVPQEILGMAMRPDFNFEEGARAKLNTVKGQNSNLLVLLEDLIRQEEDSIQSTNDKYEARTKLLPEFKKQYFEQSRNFDTEREKLSTAQTEAWNAFLEDTKKFVDKKRRSDLEIYEKEQILKYKQSLLVNKVEGQDWIPPLDLIDGKILSVDNGLGTVTINIGRLDALRVGQRFDVYKVKGETLQYAKGRVEVVKTLPKIAVCKIIKFDELDPVCEGDVVNNGPEDHPYDKKLQPQYFLSGRFLQSFSKDMVQYMIESCGGMIQTKITKNISYVVLGDQPDEDDIKLCLQLGVRKLRVRDLPAQLDYTYAEIEELKKKSWN